MKGSGNLYLQLHLRFPYRRARPEPTNHGKLTRAGTRGRITDGLDGSSDEERGGYRSYDRWAELFVSMLVRG